MGYTTDFSGQFTLNKPLSGEHAAYLRAFNHTRRIKRDASIAGTRPDLLRIACGLPIGDEGAYFVGADGDFGQEPGAKDILNYNQAPMGQPGLWCQWTPNEDGTAIEWDNGEKFYKYVEWLAYIVEHFLAPWGYVLNGEVKWSGEDSDDQGVIVAHDNAIGTAKYKVDLSDISWVRQ